MPVLRARFGWRDDQADLSRRLGGGMPTEGAAPSHAPDHAQLHAQFHAQLLDATAGGDMNTQVSGDLTPQCGSPDS